MASPQKWTGERLETGIFTETTIEHLHRYALARELAKGKTVLDIACGEGYGSNLLAETAAAVTGVDSNEITIQAARKKYIKSNLVFNTGDAAKIPAADHAFDLVVSFETLEHVSAHDAMLAEIKRVLRPGGLLLISTPDKKNYSDRTGYKNPFHLRELYVEEFTNLLKRFFRNQAIYNQQITLSSVISAAGHTGLTQFTGDFNQVKEDNGEERLYCIALAGDGEIPALPNSLFNGRSILAEALEAREKMVTSTASYKLGHTLLLPFKWLKKVFTPKTPAP